MEESDKTKLSRQIAESLISVYEESLKGTPQDNSFDEVMQLIYYTANANAVKPQRFTRARFIDLLCKEPDLVQGISSTLLKYRDSQIPETSLGTPLNNQI